MSKFPKRIPADAEVSDIDLAEEEFYVGGQRLTEERAEKLASEFERRRANLIPGGKSLSGDGSHSPTIQYRVSAEVRAEVERIAKTEGISVSKLGRRALDEYLQRHTG